MTVDIDKCRCPGYIDACRYRSPEGTTEMLNITAWMINEDVRRALRDGRLLADLREAREGERRASHPIPGRERRSLVSRIAALRARVAPERAVEPACCAA